MPETKPKKQGESIKLPQELQEALRQEIALYLSRGEKGPTRGALLLAAWRFYKRELPKQDVGTFVIPASTGVTFVPDRGLPSQLSPSADPQEPEWFERLRKILRSGHAAANIAIKSNLVAFEELVDARAGSSPPSPQTDADKVGEVEELHQKAKAIDQLARGSGAHGEGLGKRPRRDSSGTGTGR